MRADFTPAPLGNKRSAVRIYHFTYTPLKRPTTRSGVPFIGRRYLREEMCRVAVSAVTHSGFTDLRTAQLLLAKLASLRMQVYSVLDILRAGDNDRIHSCNEFTGTLAQK